VTARRLRSAWARLRGAGCPLSPALENIKKMKETIYPRSWKRTLAENLAEIVRIIRELFVGRDDVFAVQVRRGSSCIYRPIRRKLTDNDIRKHVRGKITIATYPRRDSKTMWVCVDIDTRHKDEVAKVLAELKKHGIAPVVEDSGNKGYHVLVFFEKALGNWKARAIGRAVGCGNEIFPKQNTVADGSYGSLVKAPLGIHRVTGRFCGFVNEELQPIENQYEYLKQIMATRHDGEALWQKMAPKVHLDDERISEGEEIRGGHVDIATLKPCVNALLRSGVERGRRNIACHVVACECRRTGVSVQQARAVVEGFNKKNRPPLPRGEVFAIVRSAWAKGYEYGCKDNGALMDIVKCMGKDKCPFYRRLSRKVRQGNN
jgi:hypothetical protein